MACVWVWIGGGKLGALQVNGAKKMIEIGSFFWSRLVLVAAMCAACWFVVGVDYAE